MATYFPATPDDPRRAQVRAGTADREEANTLLSAAMTVGALTPEEFTQRSASANAATTLGELDALCADLPLGSMGGALAELNAGETRVSSSGASPVRRATAVLSSNEVGGGSVVGDRLSATAVLGGVDIDLRDVEFTASTVTLRCKAIFGEVRIVVPTDVTVEVHGTPVLGAFSGDAAGPGGPNAPRVIVKGVAVFGAVSVERVARGVDTGPRRAR
ncbi:MAG: DUF1707 domain-containing protein [Gordonia sp. (in: high G+C Gram-positive bacteria)]|uniref:DUF1707 SHOCT-like domain-containing protein n=1 Tax=Gordonia sp. (in: high G+C Gram-positive bacteria) TaxID=84139 RepID=UPI0039E670BE